MQVEFACAARRTVVVEPCAVGNGNCRERVLNAELAAITPAFTGNVHSWHDTENDRESLAEDAANSVDSLFIAEIGIQIAYIRAAVSMMTDSAGPAAIRPARSVRGRIDSRPDRLVASPHSEAPFLHAAGCGNGSKKESMAPAHSAAAFPLSGMAVAAH